MLCAIAAVVLISACGAQACACVLPPTMLTASNDGQTITVSRGGEIQVDLMDSSGPPGSSLTWDASSTDATILVRDSASIQPVPSGTPGLVRQQHYIALFHALADGTAQIIGQGHRTCEAMNPAFCQQAHYTVTVQVTG